jgi:Zn-dependent metalloprotease
LCYGNRYPHIYIPGKFTFSQQKAKERLVNRVVSHYTIAAQKYDVKISASDIDKSSTRLVVYPVTKEDRIELRVTWEINIPGPVFYKIYVDVMTGEIINEEPTIIS